MSKVSYVDYVIDVRGKQKVFHVNMLAKFYKADQHEKYMDKFMVMVNHQAIKRHNTRDWTANTHTVINDDQSED